MIFLMLYGLITFGAALYTQMAVSRAVGDAARVVRLIPASENPSATEILIEDEIIESLAASAIAPLGSNQTLEDRRDWLRANIRSRIDVTPSIACLDGTCVKIVLRFPYGNEDGTRIFPAINIPGIGGTETWMPDSLVSEATVRL